MQKQFDVELVIFDMDGLMFDTERIAFTGWKQAALKYGYEIDDKLFEKTLGVGVAGVREIFNSHFGAEFPFLEIRADRVNIAEEIISRNGVPVKRGLYELLNYLNKSGVKKAVATSTSRDRALSLLRQAKIDIYFDYIICGDEVKNSKPDPEIFTKAADKLQCPYDKCLVLEDSEAGVIAAFKAGMMPIVVPDMKEPSSEIQELALKRMNSLADVKEFLEATLNKPCSA